MHHPPAAFGHRESPGTRVVMNEIATVVVHVFLGLAVAVLGAVVALGYGHGGER